MNLHEYQAKQLFRASGIPVPDGTLIESIDQLAGYCTHKPAQKWVLKAQVHAGGRGKAGGVIVSDDIDELTSRAGQLLGSHLVTHQTGPDGVPVNRLWIEPASIIDRELYLAVLTDRARQRVVIMASAAGGMDIEEVAAKTPEKIVSVAIDPAAGLQSWQCRKVGFALGLKGDAFKQLHKLMFALESLYFDKDASLVEINPLVVTDENQLLAVDAKINIDDNSLYRHKDIQQMRDRSQENEREAEASEHELNYISLDGNIGCMVNGAGLAMATMDLVKLEGGEPANFLDVGGGTTAERVAAAFKLILSDHKVEAVLVNIFGGIVRCNLIAEGIIDAVREVGVSVPVVVRLEGTNAELGLQMLAESQLDIKTASDLTTAAQMVVAATGGRA